MPHELQGVKGFMSLEHHKVFTRRSRVFMHERFACGVECALVPQSNTLKMYFLDVSLLQDAAFWLLPAEG